MKEFLVNCLQNQSNNRTAFQGRYLFQLRIIKVLCLFFISASTVTFGCQLYFASIRSRNFFRDFFWF